MNLNDYSSQVDSFFVIGTWGKNTCHFDSASSQYAAAQISAYSIPSLQQRALGVSQER